MRVLLKIKNPAKAGLFCDPAGARTQDPILKRDVLYLLSYGIVKGLQNYCFYLYMQIIFSGFFSDICNGLK